MKFVCPETEKAFELRDDLAGKTIRCPACKQVHEVPAAAASEEVLFDFSDEAAEEAAKAATAPRADDVDAMAETMDMNKAGALVDWGEEEKAEPVYKRRHQDQQRGHRKGGTTAVKASKVTAEKSDTKPRRATRSKTDKAPEKGRKERGRRRRSREEPEDEGRGRRGRHRSEKNEPMSSTTKILIGVGAGVLLVVVIVGMLVQRSSERQRKRDEVAVAMQNFQTAAEGSDLAALETTANKARNVIHRNRDVVDNADEKLAELEVGVERAKAEQLIESTFANKNAKLDWLLGRVRNNLDSEIIAGDAKLREEVTRRFGEAVHHRAKMLADDCARGEDRTEKLAEVAETYREHVEAKLGDELLAMAKESQSAKRKREQAEIFGVLDAVAERLNDEGPGAARAYWHQMRDRLKRLEDEEPKDWLAELDRTRETLAKGDNPPESGDFTISEENLPALKQLFGIDRIVAEWEKRGAEPGLPTAWPRIKEKLKALNKPNGRLFRDAMRQIEDIVKRSRQALEYLAGKQLLMREGDKKKKNEGYMAVLTLRAAVARPGIRFDRGDLKATKDRAESALTIDGTKVKLDVAAEDFEKKFTLYSEGYRFETPATPLSYQPFAWTASLARRMKKAEVPADTVKTWELMEGPGWPVAFGEKDGKKYCFFENELYTVTEADNENVEDLEAYRAAAKKLHQDIMNDDNLSQKLRLALDHVLQGTYGELAAEDYINGDFCRQVVQGPYLEKHVHKLADQHRQNLEAYRQALAKVQAGRPFFSFKRADGATVTALRVLSADLDQGHVEGGDQDANNPTRVPRYRWRIESAAEAVFARPLPERQLYPLMLVNVYEGKHTAPPPSGAPQRAEVWHPVDGLLASWTKGDKTLTGDPDVWIRAVGAETAGIRQNMRGSGPPAWGFPIHVPLYDGRDYPLGIVTPHGLLDSPAFTDIEDKAERHMAEDKWLQKCAEILKSPGDLALFFRHLAKYCLDSPMATDPGLIGRKKATGEFHQTVYQLLDRKVAGFFIGDCDDMAEFYQVVTAMQGKNSFVFSLPGHAACGYVDVDEEGEDKKYSLVFLQTGPAQLFAGEDFIEVLRNGVKSFDRGGSHHFDPESVGFLLRFGGEQRRTPYALSSEVLLDREYAEQMIDIQSYWHYHYYSTALRKLRDIIEKRPILGNYNEILGLYSMIGLYDKARNLYEEKMRPIKTDPRSRLSNLLRMMDLCARHDDKDQMKKYLQEVMIIMKEEYLDKKDIRGYLGCFNIRTQVAAVFLEEGDFLNGLNLLKTDLDIQPQLHGGYLPGPLLRVLAAYYSEIRRHEDAGKPMSLQLEKWRDLIALEIEKNLSRFFLESDSFNNTLGKYSMLGTFAIARFGRETSIEKLCADGPYPEGERQHHERGAAITDEDWAWFRVCPQLAWGLAQDFLDKENKPETYAPEKAVPLIEAMRRGYRVATERQLGSMELMDGLMLTAALRKALFQQDKEAFTALFIRLGKLDHSSYYQAAAEEFGRSCGYIRMEEMPEWMEIFHKHVPGKQYYFRAAYAAVRAKQYDRGLYIGERSADFFPDEKSMSDEAKAMKPLIEHLKKENPAEESDKKEAA